MTDYVDETLQLWRTTPLVWGHNDCLLSIASYVEGITGQDWGAEFRGTYVDEAGAYAHVAARGGEAALIDRSGLERVTEPARPCRGDIVLADLTRLVAGLCTGPGAAFRLERGTSEIDLRFVKIIAVWRVPPCRPLVPLLLP